MISKLKLSTFLTFSLSLLCSGQDLGGDISRGPSLMAIIFGGSYLEIICWLTLFLLLTLVLFTGIHALLSSNKCKTVGLSFKTLPWLALLTLLLGVCGTITARMNYYSRLHDPHTKVLFDSMYYDLMSALFGLIGAIIGITFYLISFIRQQKLKDKLNL